MKWYSCSQGYCGYFLCLCLPLVFVMLSCTFRYGRDDMDVMGMAFRRDIFLCTRQVYPPLQDVERSTHTKMQEKLLRKLGNDAYPFFFEVRRIHCNTTRVQIVIVLRRYNFLWTSLNILSICVCVCVYVSFQTTCPVRFVFSLDPMMLERYYLPTSYTSNCFVQLLWLY